MSGQFNPILALSILSAGALVAERFVTHAGAQAGAAVNTLGVARAKADAIGEAVPVDVLGTAIVESGGAIAVGAALETDATGRAVTKAAGPTVARALRAAAGAGERIEVLLIPN